MTREEFRTKIAEKGYLLLDGGTGSVLRTMGMPAGVSTEKWAYEHPEVIGELQRQYAEAGSDVIYAPTFAANRISLENMGMHLQDDGILSVNDEKLQQAAASAGNDLSSFSVLKDFSSSLLRKSDQVSLNPMDYVDKKIVAYKNPGHNFISPYTTSAYSGMMFNSYC